MKVRVEILTDKYMEGVEGYIITFKYFKKINLNITYYMHQLSIPSMT